jgi:hypothetical protein
MVGISVCRKSNGWETGVLYDAGRVEHNIVGKEICIVQQFTVICINGMSKYKYTLTLVVPQTQLMKTEGR